MDIHRHIHGHTHTHTHIDTHGTHTQTHTAADIITHTYVPGNKPGDGIAPCVVSCGR